MESPLIQKSKAYAEEVLKQLPSTYVYHNLKHTQEVATAAEEIGTACELSEDDLETVIVAAWLHDIGYKQSCDQHELHSAQTAEQLLKEWNASEHKIQKVVKVIHATQMPQKPTDLLEEVICDADMYHLSNGNFEENSNTLRQEFTVTKNMCLNDEEWNALNLKFLKAHHYFTPYGKEMLEERKKKNIKKLKKKLGLNENKGYVKDLEKEVEKLRKKLEKKANPERGIETMFRVASKNHITLSSMADTKSNIMISINSIILSLIVSVLFRKLEEYPYMLLPTLMLVATCLAAIVFAILATLPNISTGKFTRQDIERKNTNLLFFGNFYAMNLKDYEGGMREMMNDGDFLYSSLMKDIYFNGKVLARKYKMLRFSYGVFMFGFVSSIIAFLAAVLIYGQPAY